MTLVPDFVATLVGLRPPNAVKNREAPSFSATQDESA